jgi:hypothetical protein
MLAGGAQIENSTTRLPSRISLGNSRAAEVIRNKTAVVCGCGHLNGVPASDIRVQPGVRAIPIRSLRSKADTVSSLDVVRANTGVRRAIWRIVQRLEQKLGQRAGHSPDTRSMQ